MYDPRIVDPMRAEARAFGCTELPDPAAVHQALKDSQGLSLVFVNSVCGCAAGGARPGLRLALQNAKAPKQVWTVFAGQDREATAAAREYFLPYQPSSPQIALLKDGRIVHMLQRHDIEGRSPEMIAAALGAAFEANA